MSTFASHLLRGTGEWEQALADAGRLSAMDSTTRDEWPVLLAALDREPTGTGYVVDSLVSARHALEQGADFASVVRHAIALGNDTDTTAAIAGGLAGIRHGRSGIPDLWVNMLRGRDLLDPMLVRLLEYAATPLAREAVVRTSQSHPLRIGTLTLAGTSARIGVTFCPGKQQSDALTGIWRRDLDIDLAAAREWGAQHLVTLLEAHEFDELGVQDLGQKSNALGLTWHHAPIVDGGVPDAGFEDRWQWVGHELQAALDRGESLIVHCKGGLGRAGTVAARLLLERRECASAADAIQRVRSVRPDAVENARQEQFLVTLSTKERDHDAQETP